MAKEVLTPAAVHFADILGRIVDEQSAEVLLAAGLAYQAVEQGHVCFDLARPFVGELEGADRGSYSLLPPTDRWLDQLAGTSLCGDGSVLTPLVLNGTDIYLSRFWHHERRIAQGLLDRTGQVSHGLDEKQIQHGLDRFFPDQDHPPAPGSQRLAAEIALRRQLAIVSGGPGTGKTTTIVKVLALLQEQAMHATGKPLRVVLMAPTGKAAARLVETIRKQKGGLPVTDEIRAAIGGDVVTLHRGLGYRGQGRRGFRHNEGRPLDADLVVVDEASMIDVELMANLFAALPQSTRLILLGDRDQLTSIGAGSILSDICYAAVSAGSAVGENPLAGCAVHLSKAYRFTDQENGIGQTLAAIAAGDADAALELLTGAKPSAARIMPLFDGPRINSLLGEEIIGGFSSCLECASVEEALYSIGRYRVLCAHRHGLGGVQHINNYAEEVLSRQGLIRTGGSPWYRGRPVMITENSYAQRLFNGDVGLTWPDPARNGQMRVFFTGEDPGDIRSFLPGRIPAHETVYAMTVHKSQGSEYDSVGLVLPAQLSPIMTRELLYTGISRARNRVNIYGAPEDVRRALLRRVEKVSGLGKRLAMQPS